MGNGVARGKGDEDTLVVMEKMYTALLRQYRPQCQGKKFQSHVMTVNRVAVFCVTWLHEGTWRLRLAGSGGRRRWADQCIYMPGEGSANSYVVN